MLGLSDLSNDLSESIEGGLGVSGFRDSGFRRCLPYGSLYGDYRAGWLFVVLPLPSSAHDVTVTLGLRVVWTSFHPSSRLVRMFLV